MSYGLAEKLSKVQEAAGMAMASFFSPHLGGAGAKKDIMDSPKAAQENKSNKLTQ